MTPDRIIEVLLALLTGVVGFVSFRLSTRAIETQKDADRAAVDAAAYDRARDLYESAIQTLRQDLADTRVELKGAQEEIIRLRRELATVRGELATLKFGRGGTAE